MTSLDDSVVDEKVVPEPHLGRGILKRIIAKDVIASLIPLVGSGVTRLYEPMGNFLLEENFITKKGLDAIEGIGKAQGFAWSILGLYLGYRAIKSFVQLNDEAYSDSADAPNPIRSQ